MKRVGILTLSLLLVAILVIPTSAQDDAFTLTAYRTEDGAFGAILVEGWVASGSREDGLYIANSQELLDAMNTDTEVSPQSGQVAITVIALPPDLMATLQLAEDATLVDILSLISQFFLEPDDSGEVPQLSEVSEFDFNGKPAAMVEGVDSDSQALVVLYDLAPDTLGLGVVATVPGELEAVREDGLALVDGVGYSLPLDQVFESTAVGATIAYPADWFAQDLGGGVGIANEETLFDQEGDLTEGQYGIIVLNATTAGVEGADIAEMTVNMANDLQEEGDELSPLVTLTVGDWEVFAILVSNESGGNEGGLYALETDKGVMMVIYAAANGQDDLIGFTAFNMLLSIE